ncbi:hypothetical protein AB1Y20_001977 [Prymnesium parvum]|uniref:Rhodanese domain-containing protein n=1 Tax=Prymnesium parvum TaxID=97485 RepID=A0AB34J791_PRYPA
MKPNSRALLMLLSLRLLSASLLHARMPSPTATPRTRALACSFPSRPDHIEEMLEGLASGEAQLLDVREHAEALAGKLQLAQLAPLSELQRGVPPPLPLPRDKITYIHCAAGIRVHYAAPILQAMGFERVVPLQEGFAALRAMGMKVEPGEE